MQPLASKAQLVELEILDEQIAGLILAAESEDWSAAIRKDPKTFKALLASQAKHERAVAKYLKDFSDNRVTGLVNWQQYRTELAKQQATQAADFKVDVAIDVLQGEERSLIKVILDLLFDGIGIGVNHASRVYKQPADIENIVQVAEKQAQQYGASLAKGLNKTTAGIIQDTVAKSLALGEDVDTAAKRLRGVINSPVRAQMIAHTETVNAWGGGINQYGIQTKAKGKVLNVVSDKRTSPICQELNLKYGSPSKKIPVTDEFVWSGGSSSSPGFHVFCRTGMYLIY